MPQHINDFSEAVPLIRRHVSPPSLCLKRIRRIALCAFWILVGKKLGQLENNVIIHPVKIPYDPAQYPGDYDGIWWDAKEMSTWRGEALCYLPLERFKEIADRQTDEKRLLAEYYYGRRLACSRHQGDPQVFPLELNSTLWKERESERLQGLSFMYNTGGLKILYPEVVQSFQQYVFDYIRYEDSSSEYYHIDGCVYFTRGILLCPDEPTFNTLKSRF